MKKILAILAIALATLPAFGAPPTVDALVAKLPESVTRGVRNNAVLSEARTNPEFYAHLKASSWTLEDVRLSRPQVVTLAFSKGELDQFSDKEAAQYLATPAWKSYVAARLKSFPTALEKYDWLVSQRLVLVEAGARDQGERSEFLTTIANEILATDKEKSERSAE